MQVIAPGTLSIRARQPSEAHGTTNARIGVSIRTGTRAHENILVFKIGHNRVYVLFIVLEHSNDQKTMTDLMNFKRSLS